MRSRRCSIGNTPGAPFALNDARGTRVPVDSLIDYLEAGDTLDEFLDNFPSVTREAAIAALEEAKTLLTRAR